MRIRQPALALKPRGDVTRNPKQGYQWPQNRTCVCVRQKYLKKKQKKKQLVKLLINAGDNNNRETALYQITSVVFHYHADIYRSKYAKLLLKAGAHVNVIGKRRKSWNKNFQMKWFCRSDAIVLLFAAGEKFSKRLVKKILDLNKGSMHLQHLCRQAIRKHLLKLDPQENLFVRVPRLPLPKAVQSYLLYDQTLDDVAEETDESSPADE